MAEEEIKSTLKLAPLWLTLVISLISLIASFLFIASAMGVNTSNFDVLFDHTVILGDFIAQAIGRSFGLPLVHLAISSFFKSQRNKKTRRLIFIGWGVVIVLLNIIQG